MFGAHQGNVLDDDLAADMQGSGQGCAGQGLLGLQEHLSDLFSPCFSGHGISSNDFLSFLYHNFPEKSNPP